MATKRITQILFDPPAMAFWLAGILLGIAYGAQFVGPFNGWLDNPMLPIEEEWEPMAFDEPETGGDVIADAPEPPAASTSQDHGGPTPEQLRPALNVFARWLEMQQRRQGQVVTKVSANQTGDTPTLNVVVTDAFASIEPRLQRQVLESFSYQWSLCCSKAGITDSKYEPLIHVENSSGEVLATGNAHNDVGLHYR